MQYIFRLLSAVIFFAIFGISSHVTASTFNSASDFIVNASATYNLQEDPDIIALDDGTFVVGYTTWPTGHGSAKFRFRKFSSDGVQIGDTVSINNQLVGTHKTPRMHATHDGSIMVGFRGRDGLQEGVFMQALNSDLTPSGDSVLVNTTIEGQQQQLSFSEFNEGGYIVVWTSFSTSQGNVYGQRLDASLNKVGDEFRISEVTGNANMYPQVAVFSDNSFVVVWNDLSSGPYVLGQRYNSDGEPIGDNTVIYSGPETRYPRVLIFENDEYLVSWAFSTSRAMGQRFKNHWQPIRDPFFFYDSGKQEFIRTEVFSDDSYLVLTAEAGTGGNDVYAQRFDKFDAPSSRRLPVSSVTEGIQTDLRAAVNASGNFMVVWEGHGEEGTNEIYGNIFTRSHPSFKPSLRLEKRRIVNERKNGFRTQISIDDDITNTSEIVVTVSAISNPELLPSSSIVIVDGTLSSLSLASTETYDKIISFNVAENTYGAVTVSLMVIDGDNQISTSSIYLYVQTPVEGGNNMVLWLDGSDPLGTGEEPSDNTTLGTWTDKSASSNSVTQGTNSRKPLFVSGEQNSLGVVSFDGTDDVMSHTSLLESTALSDITIFAVYRSTANAAENRLYGFGGASFDSSTTENKHLNIGSDASLQFDDTYLDGMLSHPTSFVIRTTIKSGNTYSDYLNGEENIVNETLDDFSIIDTFYIGQLSTATQIDVAEIVVYNSVITGDTRIAIEAFLEDKWGITTTSGGSNTPSSIIGKALVFPNPFRASETARYGYELEENMNVELHLLNSLGQLVQKTMFHSGTEGGKSGYNKVPLDTQSAFGKRLPAGAYFFVLTSQGTVIGKGKFAILP